MCRWGFLKMEDPHNHRFLDQNCIILDDLGLDFRNPPDLKGFADLARIIGARYILCRCAAIRRSWANGRGTLMRRPPGLGRLGHGELNFVLAILVRHSSWHQKANFPWENDEAWILGNPYPVPAVDEQNGPGPSIRAEGPKLPLGTCPGSDYEGIIPMEDTLQQSNMAMAHPLELEFEWEHSSISIVWLLEGNLSINS